MSIGITETAIRNALRSCDPTSGESVCVPCGATYRGEMIYLVMKPSRSETGRWDTGLFARDTQTWRPVPDTPAMAVDVDDITWLLPLVQSVLSGLATPAEGGESRESVSE